MSAHFQTRKNIKPTAHKPKAKRQPPLPDRRLAAAAANAIKVLTTVPQEAIRVTARHGWLHLEGTVHWRHQRVIVEDVTRHLPGVRGLTDAIIIQAALQ